MKLTTPLLIALACLFLVDCAETSLQPPKAQSLSWPPSAPILPTAVCDINGNLKPVPFVKLSFDAGSNKTPEPDGTTAGSDITSDLATAFNANPTFKNALCALDGLFIDPSGCSKDAHGAWDPTTCPLGNPGSPVPQNIPAHSWAIRTFPPNPAPNQRFVGIALGLWNNQNSLQSWPCPPPRNVCAPPLDLLEKQALAAVLIQAASKQPGTATPPGANPLSFAVSPTGFGDNWASVLAVLSHEVGHVLWFDTFVVNPSGQPNPGGDFFNNPQFCAGNFYPGGKWQNSQVAVHRDSQGRRYLDFAALDPHADQDVRNLPPTFKSGGFANVSGLLHSIYNSDKWASALAAFTPDEDFVETFELVILSKTGLRRLTINIGPQADPVLPPRATSKFAAKFACFP